jgi:sensory rhodopsin
MFGSIIQPSDIVGTSFAIAAVATLTCAVLMFLGLTWSNERWRLPVALAGAALLAAALQYVDVSHVWLATQKVTSAHRYAAWFVVLPLQVASVYFLANAVGVIPPGIFWRTVVAAFLMVLCRYLGEAGIFNPTLGVLLSIAFWLYILGEMYFGRMSDVIQAASRPVRIGYFWMRLIMTIGWAIYPILYFVDVVIGVGHVAPVITLYTIADLVNLIALSLSVLAVAGKEQYRP